MIPTTVEQIDFAAKELAASAPPCSEETLALWTQIVCPEAGALSHA
ncbi:hypothetical protein HMPREF1285_01662 [Corynebacterium sp. KPL1859]|nr:hypothetical protein HMPREF1285_01662 [Corynebacterium sp. KPL1859]